MFGLFKKKEPVVSTNKWASDSLLNTFSQEQTNANIEGRKYVVDGILTKTPARVIEDFDPKNDKYDFMIVDDQVSTEECNILRSAIEANLEDLNKVRESSNDYWKGRVLYMPDIRRTSEKAADTLAEVLHRSVESMEKFYNLKQRLWCDAAHLVFWPTGISMPPHADNANPDGSHHGMAWREFASICYLNDDYEGGHVYFTAHDTSIKPRKGRNVAFTGGFHHEHAVLKVTKGLRFTMPAFYTFDENHKDQNLYK
jgi:hypothetical protein